MKKIPNILLLLSLVLSSGCAWLGSDDEETTDTSGYTERDFYEKIQSSLNARRWNIAIENLQLLESQFPFGKYAEQAQLELIYAQYRSVDYEACIASADRFIRLHPQHPNVDYAYYLKGLSELSQTSGLLDSFMPTDHTMRDPGTARQAFTTLTEMLSRFPESPYAPDARKRMINLRNELARAEIHAANYYFSRGAYLAAANRGRYVVENFQQTPAVPDGLAVMAQAYYLLGMDSLSDNAARVLAINYPEYPALDEAGNFDFDKHLPRKGDRVSLLNTITFGLIERAKPPIYDTRERYNPVLRDGGNIDSDEQSDNDDRSIWSWLTFGLID